MDKIDQILLDLPKKYDGLSDIHLSSGKRVSLRHKGELLE